MITLDLSKGFGDYEHYNLFMFPGGEIHFISKIDLNENIRVVTKLNSATDILALCIVVDTIRKDQHKGLYNTLNLEVFIPYFPYQQADRDFGVGECFSLKTITNILNNLLVDKYIVFDPHSDVTPALLRDCKVIDNSDFITEVLREIYPFEVSNRFTAVSEAERQMIWLSPDAGAYKKISKLAEKIGFKGEIVCCQKNRDLKTGKINVVVPNLDAPGGKSQKDVLIIDDICVGGKTFTEISNRIPKTGNRKLYLAVSHGIFSTGLSYLKDHRFDKIFTTNSRGEYVHYFGEGDKEFLSVYKIR